MNGRLLHFGHFSLSEIIMNNNNLLFIFAIPFLLITSVQAEPNEPLTLEQLKVQAGKAIAEEQSVEAVKLLNEIIKQEPNNAPAWYRLGCENFRIGKFKQSVASFDQYVKLEPAAERKLWERGISHYYAGMYKEGAEQFALYQTYHDNDVENSVWRYICMAKTEGLKKAREEMLPIKNDPRIPLMTAYAMFQGKATPEDVLKKAKEGDPTEEVLAGRLFYAQLYLGLYYEAHSQPKLARKYITQAWKDHEKTKRISRYMWNVARVHAQLLNQKKEN